MNQKTIPISPGYIPKSWYKRIESKKLVGGVFMLFLSGKDKKEIDRKIVEIRKFCKTLNK